MSGGGDQEWEELGEDTSVEDAQEAVVEVIETAEQEVLHADDPDEVETSPNPSPNPAPNPASTSKADAKECPANRRPFRVLLTSECASLLHFPLLSLLLRVRRLLDTFHLPRR
jgi:hypothetical protein